MYICIYVYVYLYICMYVYMYICIYIYMYVCMYTYGYVHVCGYGYAYMGAASKRSLNLVSCRTFTDLYWIYVLLIFELWKLVQLVQDQGRDVLFELLGFEADEQLEAPRLRVGAQGLSGLWSGCIRIR